MFNKINSNFNRKKNSCNRWMFVTTYLIWLSTQQNLQNSL